MSCQPIAHIVEALTLPNVYYVKINGLIIFQGSFEDALALIDSRGWSYR